MAPFKRGDPINRRVQAIDKDIGDLVLRDGSELRVKIGGAILPTPILKRGMGNSSVELTVHDPGLRWLKLGLAAEKWDAKIDGLWFRYLGTSKSGKQLTLRFEDRDVARLRELTGPKSVYARRGQPNETTRAEFIVSLVEELRPRLKIVCPELHEKQPIASQEKGEEAKENARVSRARGVGDVKGLTVKGEDASSAQVDIGDRALRVAEHRNAPFRVDVALMEALIVESLLGKAASNYLQLIPSTASASGIMPTDLEASVDGFLTGYIDGEGGALAYYKANPSAPAHKIAQEVQNSGAGEATDGAGNYGPLEDEAREWVEVFEGGEGSESVDVTKPTEFVVGKKESYWQAIQRLAKEVNWRAFIVAGTFFYISEPELIRSQVRLAIELDEDGQHHPAGIEEVDFDFNGNKPITSATVSAFVKKWGAPPGSVVTLEGYGPASIGFGDGPVKADDKGRRQGISSNRKAKTGEGKGRYLVSSIETPLSGDAEARLATIEIRKPTAPLPEPRAETRSVSAAESGAGTSTDALADVRITNTSPGAPYWGGTAALFKQFFHPFMEDHGLSPGGEKEQGHEPDGDHDPEGQPSGYATDYPTSSGEQTAKALALAIDWPEWQPNSYASKVIEVDGYSFDVQILSGSGIKHGDHIHVGAHRV